MLGQVLCLLLAITMQGYAMQTIHEMHDFTQLEQLLLASAPSTMVLVDIDDTIITPCSDMFRVNSPDRFFIDDLKRNKYSGYDTILAAWRLKRSTKLVHNRWPSLITQLKEQHKLVYALTQMRPGPIGSIALVEEWRYQELLSHGVSFLPEYHGNTNFIVLGDNDDVPAQSMFHKGFFLTGSFSKGDVVRELNRLNPITHLIFIDDRKDHVTNVVAACQELNIPCTGIMYRGIELIQAECLDQKIIDVQKEHLLVHHQWLEDYEAKTLLETS